MDTLFLISLIIACVMAVVFVVFSNGQKNLLSLSLKCIASFCFVFLALSNCYTNGLTVEGMLFVMGFVSSCFGDAILGLPDMPEMKEKATQLTLVGGLCFAVAHILYITAMIMLFGFAWWVILIAIALGLVFFFGNKIVGKLDYGKLNAGMPFYAIFVSFVVAESIMSFVSGADITGSLLILIGFIMFWISDIILMNIYFGNKTEDKKRILYYFNLGSYYAGQILIASSLFYLLPII